MKDSLIRKPNRPVFAGRMARGLVLGFGLITLVLVTGCPGKDSGKNSISGKVTLDNQPVSGSVSFVTPDGKDVGASPINATDGSYSLPDVPAGSVKVVVKPGLGGDVRPIAPKGGPEMPAVPGTSQGVPPPQKYHQAATTPLTYEVKTGKQTYDIQLTK